MVHVFCYEVQVGGQEFACLIPSKRVNVSACFCLFRALHVSRFVGTRPSKGFYCLFNGFIIFSGHEELVVVPQAEPILP